MREEPKMDSQFQANRLVALAAQNDVNEQRRVKHLPVAHALRNPFSAAKVIDAARAQIQLWREKHLCSDDYIAAWDALLERPSQAATMLEEQSVRAVQMRQNSPFVSSVRYFNSLAHAA